MRRDFLDADTCDRITAELRSAAGDAATVYRAGSTQVAEDWRRTKVVRVSPRVHELVDSRLCGLKPAVESHFALPLCGYEELEFLAYHQGDYYHPHCDNSPDEHVPSHIRDRCVSVVVFLNGQSQSSRDGAYVGGSLAFYGLVNDPAWSNYGFHLLGEAGLLVGFRSEVGHAVEPVTHGERFTAVTWFY